MTGAINFAMSDIYGGVWGTTEQTVPEASDQQALVDDQKASAQVANTEKKPFPVLLALALIFIIALVVGGLK